MNIKKKNFIFCLVGMFIFACLLCSGIFAVVTKSVSFNLALKIDPQIYFALELQIDYNGDGDYSDTHSSVNESSTYKIFDNKTGSGVVSWATVNQNCIVLNQVLAGNILSDLSINSKFKITVTNLTESNAVEYLNLTLNYNGEEEVFKADNGYGAVNMKYGEDNGEYAATKSFTLIPQTTLLDGYIQVPFKAEIDTELRYTATITTSELCEIEFAKTILIPGEKYKAKFDSPTLIKPYFYFEVTGSSVYTYTNRTGILEMPAEILTGNITISANVLKEWNGEILAYDEYASYSGGVGTEVRPYLISTALDLVQFASNTRGGMTYAGEYISLTNDIILNEDYEDYESWNENTTGLNRWIEAGTFGGVFNGYMHSIKGIYITSNSAFVNTILETGVIKCLKLEDGFVYANNGAPLCYMNYGIISQCYNSCNVSGLSKFAWACLSGLVRQNKGLVDQCINAGSVTYKSFHKGTHVGGICAVTNLFGTTQNCYNLGTIISTTSEDSEAAGITGCLGAQNPLSEGYIENCYNAGNVGGATLNAEIAASFCYGTITNSYGLTNAIYNYIYSNENEDISVVNCGTLATATYTGWDFENIWGWIDGYDYPVLRCFNPDARATK